MCEPVDAARARRRRQPVTDIATVQPDDVVTSGCQLGGRRQPHDPETDHDDAHRMSVGETEPMADLPTPHVAGQDAPGQDTGPLSTPGFVRPARLIDAEAFA